MKEFNEKESLQVIYEMIENSKKKLKDDGFFFLLWGWAVLIASVSNFVLLTVFESPYASMPWPFMMFTAGIVSGIVGYNRKKNRPAKSYADNLLGYLWVGFTVSILIVAIFIAFQKLTLTQGYPIIIALYGLGTFVSGGVVKFKPLIIGGILCWGISLAAAFMNYELQLLMLGLSVIVSYLIPGYLIKMEYNKSQLSINAG